MKDNNKISSSSVHMERPRTPPPRSLTNLQIHGVPDRSSSTPAGDPMSSMNQDLLNSYVKNALRPRSIRDPAAYTFILNQLQGGGSKPSIIAGWLRALGLNASELTIENSRELLSVIFKLDFTVDKEVQKAFMSLLVELCTSHSTYINQMLKSLIFRITPQKISNSTSGTIPTLLSTDDLVTTATATGDDKGITGDSGFGTCLYDEEKCEYVRAGIVKTIGEMAKLVPMSSMSILQIFTSLYPYKSLDFFVHKNWLLSALDICREVPSIREQILSTVISRLLQMDVDFRVEYEESGMLYDSIVHRSSGDSLSNDASSSTSTSPAPSADAQSFCSELSNKLDILMDILLSFVSEVFRTKSNALASLYEDDFNIFLNSFIRYVLPTYNSRVMQFLVFKICSFNEKYTQAYLDSLMNIIKDERTSELMRGGSSSSNSTSPDTLSTIPSRVSACSYVASFITRANFIKDYSIAENYLIDLLTYAKEHSLVLVEQSKRQHEKALAAARTASLNSSEFASAYHRLSMSSSGGFGYCSTANGARSNFVYIEVGSHQVFYAAVQAAMHILSYCYPQLVERALKSGFTKISWLNSLGFQAVMASPLCPLDYCNQSIVKTFRSVWNFVAGDGSALKTAYSLSTSKYPYISLLSSRGSGSRSPLRSASTSSFALSLTKSSSPTSFLASNNSNSGFGSRHNDDFNNVFGNVTLPYDVYLLSKSSRHIAPICKIYDSNFFNFEVIAEMKKEQQEGELKMVMPRRTTVAKRVKPEGYVKGELYETKEENDDDVVALVPMKKVKKEGKYEVDDDDERDNNDKVKIEIEDEESDNEEEEEEIEEEEEEEDDDDDDDDDEEEEIEEEEEEVEEIEEEEEVEEIEEEEDDDEESEEDNDDNENEKDNESDNDNSENEDDENSDSDDDDDEPKKSLSADSTSGFQYPVSITPNFNFSYD